MGLLDQVEKEIDTAKRLKGTYGWRMLLCVALLAAGVALLRQAWGALSMAKGTLSENWAQASWSTRVEVGAAAALLLSVIPMWFLGHGSMPWRWFWYTRGAPRRARALRRNVRVSATEANHGLMAIRLNREDRRGGHGRREGTISLCAHVSKAGQGIRREGYDEPYLFASSGGHRPRAWDKGSQTVWYNVNHFALMHSGGSDPCWKFRTSEAEYQDNANETTVSVPDDLVPGWHHFVCTWKMGVGQHDSDEMYLYIDGIRQEALFQPPGQVRYPEARGVLPLLIGTWTNLRPEYYAEEEIAWVTLYPEKLDKPKVERLFALQPWAPRRSDV